MRAYINQLLEDIKAAHQPEQKVSYHQTPFSIEKHFEEVERWLEGIEPAHTFAYYCGLLPHQFPPEQRLTMAQVRAVSRTFKKLLFSWNLGVDIPESMPARQAYTFLISILNEKADIVTDGCITIEFCTCYPPSCPFKEYCSCIKHFTEAEEEMGNIEDADNNDVPY